MSRFALYAILLLGCAKPESVVDQVPIIGAHEAELAELLNSPPGTLKDIALISGEIGIVEQEVYSPDVPEVVFAVLPLKGRSFGVVGCPVGSNPHVCEQIVQYNQIGAGRPGHENDEVGTRCESPQYCFFAVKEHSRHPLFDPTAYGFVFLYRSSFCVTSFCDEGAQRWFVPIEVTFPDRRTIRFRRLKDFL